MMARACLTVSILGFGAVLAVAGCGSDSSSAPANTGGQPGTGGSAGAETGGAGGSAGAATGGAAGQGGSGGSAGPSLDASCQASCDKVVAAGCSAAPTAANCWAGCMNAFSPVPNCQTQAIAMLDCAASTATISCDSNGVPVSSGCEAQTLAVNECTVCEPLSEDTTCKVCGKQKCCTEARALVDEPTSGQYAACLQGCAGNTSCVDGCKSTYAAAAAATQAAAQCLSANCVSECGG